ncbi:MAG TPA: DUF4245 domain-containing protein [Nocardioidaceae bacterium]|nr:DUF4245 domain-containing protein [Nocardioidaceae bacterium]
MSERAGRYQRSFSGMVGALLVLLAVILVLVLLRDGARDDVPDPVRAIDYSESLEFYRAEAEFPLLAPPSLPDGWKATSVSFKPARPQTWHLGVLTDEGRYIGLEQSRDTESTMVAEHVDPGATDTDPVTIAGERWNAYRDEGGDYALARRSGGITTLVVGTATEDELVAYVDSLR